MASNEVKIGYHVNKTMVTIPEIKFKTLFDAIENAYKKHKINVIQIFSHVNRSGKPMKLEFEKIKDFITTNDIELFTHGSYPTITVYKGEKVERMTSELDFANKLGAKGVVIHINKFSPDKIVSTLEKYRTTWEKYEVPILIENSAYTSKNTDEYEYNTVEKINKLNSMLKAKFPKTYAMGVLDTAHLYSAGVNSAEWIKLNLNNVRLIHLNGSEKPFGSGIDKHAIPFYVKNDVCKAESDKIPEQDLVNFIRFCKLKNKPMIIEANRGETTVLLETIHYIRKV